MMMNASDGSLDLSEAMLRLGVRPDEAALQRLRRTTTRRALGCLAPLRKLGRPIPDLSVLATLVCDVHDDPTSRSLVKSLLVAMPPLREWARRVALAKGHVGTWEALLAVLEEIEPPPASPPPPPPPR